MITKNQLKEISEYVKQYLYDSFDVSDQDWVKSFPRSADHRWQHTLNVLANAEQILEGEGADEEPGNIVRAAKGCAGATDGEVDDVNTISHGLVDGRCGV